MEEEFSMDPRDALIPCVAVIDEDSSFSDCDGCSDQATMWNNFRDRYPNRPFCLLVVKDGIPPVIPPTNFQNDTNTVWHSNIPRDNGNETLAVNWRNLCGLGSYTPEVVPSVGLFVDDSGSMTKFDVSASYNKFLNDMAAQGIHVEEVVNNQENWILPFMTTLVRE